MTPLQQLSLLAVLAAAVSAPMAASTPGLPIAAAVVEPRLTVAVRRQIRINAAHALSIDIPSAYRQSNWTSRGRAGQPEGSCAWASLVNLLHWQGEHALANRIRGQYGAGAGPDRIYNALDAAGISYAYGSDVAFLEWCIRTRRGACVVTGAWCPDCRKWHANHMLNLVGLDPQSVHLLDSNDPGKIFRRDREKFLNDWTACGSWAFTPLYSPTPPKPWKLTEVIAP